MSVVEKYPLSRQGRSCIFRTGFDQDHSYASMSVVQYWATNVSYSIYLDIFPILAFEIT